MINPNRSYKQKKLARIVKIDNPDSYIPYLFIESEDGRRYEGSLKQCHSQWKKLRVGDLIGFCLQWSIVADKPLIESVIRKHKVIK